MKESSKIILAVVVTVLVVFGIIYWIYGYGGGTDSGGESTTAEDNYPDPDQSKLTEEEWAEKENQFQSEFTYDEVSEWKNYSNDDLGISFKYPDTITVVQTDNTQGKSEKTTSEKGKIFLDRYGSEGDETIVCYYDKRDINHQRSVEEWPIFSISVYNDTIEKVKAEYYVDEYGWEYSEKNTTKFGKNVLEIIGTNSNGEGESSKNYLIDHKGSVFQIDAYHDGAEGDSIYSDIYNKWLNTISFN